MGHLLLEHLKGWPRKRVLQKIFFFENALSGAIHNTYQKASLQTDQNPTLGHPSQGGHGGQGYVQIYLDQGGFALYKSGFIYSYSIVASMFIIVWPNGRGDLQCS